MTLAAPTVHAAASADTQVVELRQYKLAPGKRDAFVDLFERQFVESQEALGMRLVGQFRDLDDPDRFVWIRSFADMPRRAEGLNAFYFGPVWKAHRDAANGMIIDSDNVLLMTPARPGDGFGALPARAAAGGAPRPAGLVVATIYYLWADPSQGFADMFDAQVRPKLQAAGLPVLAVFTPEASPNNFPRLPVRQGEKLLVWFTRVPDAAAYARAQARLSADADLQALLKDKLERAPQVLRLAPTPRSALR